MTSLYLRTLFLCGVLGADLTATTGAAVPFTATPTGGDWPWKVDFALPLGHSEIVLAEA